MSQLPPPAQTAPQDAAAAPIAAEQTQLLPTMTRDLASVQQEIEQLKAGQAELPGKRGIAEQFKANQEQMARAIASASEQNLRPRPSVAPLPAARKPVPARQTEARVQARAPQPRQ